MCVCVCVKERVVYVLCVLVIGTDSPGGDWYSEKL